MNRINVSGARSAVSAFITNSIIVAAGVFTVGALYVAMQAAGKEYPATAGQIAFAKQFCISKQHGVVGSVYVTKPDLFGANGSNPHLTVRCTFGKKEFMLKIVDLEHSADTPKAGS